MIEGQWKSDGSDNQDRVWSIENEGTDSAGQVLSLNVNPRGNPMNFLFTPSATTTARPSKFYFLVDILSMDTDSSSLSIGVARPSEFRKGFMTKGMFYNGNLTNVSGALKVSYGPRPKRGDKILVEYTEQEDSFQVKFYVDGKSLGIAFQIPKSTTRPPSEVGGGSSSPTELFVFLPCLHVEGRMKLHVSTSIELPTDLMKTMTSPIPRSHPLKGDWSLIEAFDDESNPPTRIWPLSDDSRSKKSLTLHLQPTKLNENQWSLILKVCNTLRVEKILSELEHTDDSDTTQYAIDGPTTIMSTRMMPQPPIMQTIERELSNALGSLWKTFVNDATTTTTSNEEPRLLRAQSEGGATLATFQRISRDPNAVACTSYYH